MSESKSPVTVYSLAGTNVMDNAKSLSVLLGLHTKSSRPHFHAERLPLFCLAATAAINDRANQYSDEVRNGTLLLIKAINKDGTYDTELDTFTKALAADKAGQVPAGPFHGKDGLVDSFFVYVKDRSTRTSTSSPTATMPLVTSSATSTATSPSCR